MKKRYCADGIDVYTPHVQEDEKECPGYTNVAGFENLRITTSREASSGLGFAQGCWRVCRSCRSCRSSLRVYHQVLALVHPSGMAQSFLSTQIAKETTVVVKNLAHERHICHEVIS